MNGKYDKEMAALIDYSNIQTYKVSDTDCENLAMKAKLFGFNTVVVTASSLPIIQDLIGDTDIKVAVAVSYPSGAYILESKIQEIDGLFETGYSFDELYITLAVGRFLSGYEEEAVQEIKAFRKAAKDKTIKLVVEAGVMNKQQKAFICNAAADAGIAYIVASTGFAPYDVPFPTAEDIAELKQAAGGRVKIVACGDIHTKDAATIMLAAGADRVCSAKAYEIVRED